MQEHHTFSQALAANDPVLGMLARNGLFNLHGPDNMISLPDNQAKAQAMGKSLGLGPNVSVSPHNGGPLGSYEGRGMGQFLKDLLDKNKALFDKAEKGDKAAQQAFGNAVSTAQKAAKEGLLNGTLYTNTPSTMSKITTQAVNGRTFATEELGSE